VSIRANFRGLMALALLGAGVAAPARAEVITEYEPFIYDTETPEVLELAGAINHRAAVLFKLALNDFPKVTTLSLSSEGGSVYAALPAAYDVRVAGLKTMIPEGKTCASACSYLFFAGAERMAEGRLGVHQIATSSDSLSDGQVTLGDIFKAFEDFGVPTSVISRMMRTPADSMYLFDPEEMERLGLLGPVPGATEVPVEAPAQVAEPTPQPEPEPEPQVADPVTPATPEPEPAQDTQVAAVVPAPAPPATGDADGLDAVTNALDPMVAACFDAALPWANDFGWPGIRSKQIQTGLAIPACERARAQAPENDWVTISLARALGEAGQDARAVSLYEPIANSGNAYAQGSLGVFYLNGRGVAKNQGRAYRLFLDAAAQGNATANFALAVINAFPSHTIANDMQAAIDYAYEALAAGEDRSPQIYRDMNKFPHAVRVGVQRRLQREGFYSGALDGAFGPGSMAAARLLALSRQAEG
jgi:TPR repeat protein